DVVRLARQGEGRRGGDVRRRATRNVVQDHRNVPHRVGDGPEVRLEPRLRGLVVVRGHDEDRVGAGGSSRAGPLDRGGGGVAPHAREHLRSPSGRLDRERDDALVFDGREGRGFARGSAGDEQSHPTRNLPLDQRPKPRLVHLAGGVERGDESSAATAQPFQMFGHRTFLSFSGSSARRSCSTSAKAYIPRRPTIHRAASSAPAAKPARDRAVWTNNIWSATESNPTRCVPAMCPARVLAIGTLVASSSPSPRDRIPCSVRAVPEGASRLRAWWASSMNGSYPAPRNSCAALATTR